MKTAIHHYRRYFAAILSAGAALVATANAGELVTLPSRADATQGIYIDAPKSQPAWVIVLLPGGNGSLRLSDRGATQLTGNFVIRTASYWTDGGEATALFDTPSDHADGVKDHFRLSKDAVKDIEATVSEIRKRFPNAKVALLGTSRGTITAGNVLKRNPAAADAYILTSPVTQANKGQLGLSELSWPDNKARVLVVSNEHDGCDVSPFDAAKNLASTNGFDFIAVSSNLSKRNADECGANSPHGFLGIETSTLDAIRKWLEK
jgi:pimeloyl-ACP methyl ester carboxylesterase